MSEECTGPSGVVVWFTGLSGSGKTTLSRRLERICYDVQVLDGDELRKDVSPDLGFSKEDRDEHVRRVGRIAKELASNGTVVIVSLISPYRAVRDEVRELIESSGKFVEIYVNAPLKTCEARDPKGLYAKAQRGEVQHFTGISDPYEEPKTPTLVVETKKETPEECTKKVLMKLQKLNLIPSN